MNNCCTAPTSTLDAIATPAPRRSRWPFAGLERVLDAASFTAVDLTEVVFVDPDRLDEATPRRSHSMIR